MESFALVIAGTSWSDVLHEADSNMSYETFLESLFRFTNGPFVYQFVREKRKEARKTTNFCVTLPQVPTTEQSS